MQIIVPLKSLSERSSFVKTRARKRLNVVKGIIPQDKDQFGTVEVAWAQDVENENLYRMEWRSRMTNSVTIINKLGSGKFMVSRTSPSTEAVNFMFNNVEPAIKAFFYNTDLFRTQDANADKARRWCAEHLKRSEKLKTLRFNPSKHKQAQTQLDRTIKLGEDRSVEAKLVGIDFNGRNVRVKIYNSSTKKFDIEKTVPTTQAWFE